MIGAGIVAVRVTIAAGPFPRLLPGENIVDAAALMPAVAVKGRRPFTKGPGFGPSPAAEQIKGLLFEASGHGHPVGEADERNSGE